MPLDRCGMRRLHDGSHFGYGGGWTRGGVKPGVGSGRLVRSTRRPSTRVGNRFRWISMRVLVSNDDGVDAPGIRILAEHLKAVGEVTVVAPDRDRSGASNSLTLDAADPRATGWTTATTGSPARRPIACYLALSGLLDQAAGHRGVGHQQLGQPGRRRDLFRHGLGGDGGRFLGLPAIAVSLVTRDHPASTTPPRRSAVLVLMQRLLVDPLPADTILNVNVPDRPWDGDPRIRGDPAGQAASVPRRASSRPTPAVGRSGGSARPAASTTPVPAPISTPCSRGFVSVTPIHPDITRYQALEKVSGWVQSHDRRDGRRGRA